MRLLFSSTSGAGHWLPLVPIAQAAVAAGHAVRVAVPEAAADGVRRQGLDVVPFDDAEPSAEQRALFERAERDGDLEAAQEAVVLGFGFVSPTAALPRLRASFDEFQPDVVVTDPSEFAARSLAEQRGLPLVIGLASLQASLAHFEGLMTAPWERLRAGLGLPETGSAATPDLLLTPLPPSYDAPVAIPEDRIVRYRDREAGGRGPDSDPALVYATIGTEALRFPLGPGLVATIVEALGALEVAAVLTVGAEPPPDLPSAPNVDVRAFADHAEVVPRASVVVCHGGSGTVLDALRAGRPLVVTPLFADQFHNAQQVEDRRLGRAVVGEAQTPAAVRAAVEAGLGGTFAAATAAIAAEIAALPALAEAVLPQLEALPQREP